jgi:hypothetical protein
MNVEKNLSEIYPFDAESRTFTVPAAVDRYDGLFNALDPSPAPARDLVTELVAYLEQCSDEIPLKYPLKISIRIRAEARSAAREQECTASLRTNYRHEMLVTLAEISRRRWNSLRYVLASLLCLAFYIWAESWPMGGFLWDVFHEAVLIGGWVFMWEAVSVNFIQVDEKIQQKKKYERLTRAEIVFLYEDEGENRVV